MNSGSCISSIGIVVLFVGTLILFSTFYLDLQKENVNNDVMTDLSIAISLAKYELFDNSYTERLLKSTYDQLNGLKSVNEGNELQLKNILNGIMARSTPIVFRNSSAKNWNALRWDCWSIAMKWTNLNGVHYYSSNGNPERVATFVIQGERDKGGMIGLSHTFMTDQEKLDLFNSAATREKETGTESGFTDESYGDSSEPEQQPPTVIEDLLLADFLLLSRDVNSRLLYVTNYLEFEEVAGTHSDTSWRDFLVSEKIAAEAGIDAVVPPNFWMLHPQTCLQLRYAEYHSIRVQVKGSSRVVLVPPDQSEAVRPFPSIHASQGQAQVGWSPQLAQ